MQTEKGPDLLGEVAILQMPCRRQEQRPRVSVWLEALGRQILQSGREVSMGNSVQQRLPR